MKKSVGIFVLSLFFCLAGSMNLFGTEDGTAESIRIGAYYFDGWSGEANEEGYTYHITKRLVNEFPEREPVWGWRAETIDVMAQQIDYAADFGLSFFAFCWYYPEKPNKVIASNNALDLFLRTPNRDRLRFALLVANHPHFRVGPADWDIVCDIWIRYFQEENYEQLNGKPLLIFYSGNELLKAFGSPEATKVALEQLHQKAEVAGLPGVTVAGGVLPNEPIEEIEACGFDLLTGYNYPCYGFDLDRSYRKHPYEDMIKSDLFCWNYISEKSALPYMPSLSIGWDMRPWEPVDSEPKTIYFVDQTQEKITNAITTLINWVHQHTEKRLAQPIAIIYAWNENGEGGYMTPTKKGGTEILEAVREGIRDE